MNCAARAARDARSLPYAPSAMAMTRRCLGATQTPW